jgi:hypothetical protein
MSDIQIVDTLRPRSEMADTFVAVRAEALFGSVLQPSESPDPEQVQRAVTATLRRLGLRGCPAHVAGEFGDHPDTAVTRMTWALATVRTVYAVPAEASEHAPQPLALAS